MQPKPWSRRVSKKLADYKIFTIRGDTLVSPRTGQEHDFYIIEAVNWVNVVALTSAGEIIMVEQYRHGATHGSNYLFLDMHVGLFHAKDENDLPRGLDPWDVDVNKKGDDPPTP